MRAPVREKYRVAILVLAGALIAYVASGATFIVDSIGDEPDDDLSDGACHTALSTCTLRAALEQANALAGADTILFNIPGPEVHTITPASPLPPLTDDAGVTIDGYSQPGSSPNTLAVGNDAVLTIELSGAAGRPGSGLRIQSRSVTVRGLVINQFDGAGVSIESGFDHRIEGCFLGTDPTGTSAMGNRVGLIIDLFPAAASIPASATGSLPSAVLVGGTSPAERNVFSGNSSDGLAVLGVEDCLIQGNYIGTDSSGRLALPNRGNGVSLAATTGVTVGGTTPGAANVVSGNIGSGILLVLGGVNLIQGNLIGTDASGAAAIPNGTGVQLVVESGDFLDRNLVSGNDWFGVRIFRSTGTVITGNLIGTDLTGAMPLGNRLSGVLILGSSSLTSVGSDAPNVIAYNGGSGISIGADIADPSSSNLASGNSIHDNLGLGIDLADDGVTPNDDCDRSPGPNLLRNYPVLMRAISLGGSTTIEGTLNSVPNSSFSIEFFSTPSCHSSGYGQGETYLGSTVVTTDGACNVNFQATLPADVAPGSVVTATATDSAGNTSEFSACRPVEAGNNS